MSRFDLLSLSLILIAPLQLWPCSYCDASFSRKRTLREDATAADFVLVGTLSNPQMAGVDTGTTDFSVSVVLRMPANSKAPSAITLPRYIAVDPKAKNEFILFCRTEKSTLDAYRGQTSNGVVADYLRKALELPGDDRRRQLIYFAGHLDSTDASIAADAFLEMAKASDAEIRLLQNALPTDRLRKLIAAPQTPPSGARPARPPVSAPRRPSAF